jgi:hypothetical protein
LRRKAGKLIPARTFSSASRFLDRQALVFDFWVAVYDDMGGGLFGPPAVSVQRPTPNLELPEG